MRAIIHKLNKTFTHCDIFVCDTLNRFNFMMVNKHTSESKALVLSIEQGNNWLKDNQHLLQELTVNHQIIRWDSWLNSSKFKNKLALIETEYAKNASYQQAFEKSAITFLSRRKLPITENLQKCIRYLQEECAVMLLWADKGYTFELYTTKRNLAMQATYEIFIKKLGTNILIPVMVDVKHKIKREQEIINVAFQQLLNLNFIKGHIYLKAEDGTYLYCNKTQADALNLNIEDVIGQTDYDFFSKEQADKYRKVDREIIKSGKERVIEESWFFRGDNRIFLSTKVPLFGRDNKVIGLLGISVDIIEQKYLQQLQQEQIEYQTQLHAQELFKQCFSGIQDLLQKTQIKLVNRNAPRVTEITPLKMLRMKLSRREEQILYLLSLNKSTKDIANILGIIDGKELSYKTILSIINKKLYVKFEVFSVSELISKARSAGLIPFFPQSFVNYEHLIK